MSIQLQPEQGTAIVPAGTWKVDPAHSSLEFAVKHLVTATVKGRFTDFDAAIEVGDEGARAAAVVRTASIATHESDRDNHLRSPDFFDAERYPEIRFESTRIEHVDGSAFRVVGDLTIKGVSREVELEATFQGTWRDPWGNERVALAARGEIDRRDFGLTWNQLLEAGGVLVSDAVKLAIDVSAVRAA